MFHLFEKKNMFAGLIFMVSWDFVKTKVHSAIIFTGIYFRNLQYSCENDKKFLMP